MGGYAGNRLGAIRDAKGKSVAAVFAELGGAQKAEVRRKSRMVPDVIPLMCTVGRYCALSQ